MNAKYGMNRMLSVEEASTYLGVHKITLYRLIKRGKVPFVHIGGQLKISPEGLETFIAKSGECLSNASASLNTTLLREVPGLAVILDRSFSIVDLSEITADFFDMAYHNMVGARFMDCFLPESRSQVRSCLASLSAKPQRIPSLSILRHDSTTHVVSCIFKKVLNPLLDEQYYTLVMRPWCNANVDNGFTLKHIDDVCSLTCPPAYKSI